MSQVTEQSVRFQTALASIKLIQASAVLDLTEDDFDFLTSNKVWIATDRSRARRCVEACVYGTLDFVGYPRFPAPVEFIAAVIAYYVHPVNIQTACLIMEGAEFTENIINGVERPVKAADRKSGSAGMPRPISYAVFCLKKKRRRGSPSARRASTPRSPSVSGGSRPAPPGSRTGSGDLRGPHCGAGSRRRGRISSSLARLRSGPDGPMGFRPPSSHRGPRRTSGRAGVAVPPEPARAARSAVPPGRPASSSAPPLESSLRSLPGRPLRRPPRPPLHSAASGMRRSLRIPDPDRRPLALAASPRPPFASRGRFDGPAGCRGPFRNSARPRAISASTRGRARVPPRYPRAPDGSGSRAPGPSRRSEVHRGIGGHDPNQARLARPSDSVRGTEGTPPRPCTGGRPGDTLPRAVSTEDGSRHRARSPSGAARWPPRSVALGGARPPGPSGARVTLSLGGPTPCGTWSGRRA